MRQFKLGVIAFLWLITVFTASAAPKKILFFTKSSGYEHSVISWKTGQPSFAEKVLLDLGQKNGWEFTFSKDGSKFSPEYLNQFDAVFFYTTGDLCSEGTDKQPPMTAAGKQALFDYVRAGKGFLGTHAADDTFHTANEDKKGPDRYLNHGDKADPYVRFIGGEFIIHGAQQVATNTVTDASFPGFEKAGANFAFPEEWYSLKDFSPDIHVLTVIDAPHMKGPMYDRPAYPTTWARNEGKGRVWYTAMGHREDVWTNPLFQAILVGGIKWVLGEVSADVTPNLTATAPGAGTNPLYVEPKAAPAKNKADAAANTLTEKEKAAGWKLLWDGKTTEGWHSPKDDSFPTKSWSLENGELKVVSSGNAESQAGGDIITRDRYANFELTADFKTTLGCNSGIKIFVQPNLSPIDKVTGKPSAVGSAIGMEFQVLDDVNHPDAKLGRNGDRTLGSLYDLIPAPKDKKVMPMGEWNHARILSQGQHVEFWLNGKKTVEFDRGSAAFREAVALSKFKDIPNFGEWADGHILLQEHGSVASFRNIKLRELPAN
ncbi:MAG TPA: family 16 glycoside hydrolase [Verrucomicrobiae bacterium]|nr:family 16 glycoside hydrolase [Verrucomicrobiae bacterium]